MKVWVGAKNNIPPKNRWYVEHHHDGFYTVKNEKHHGLMFCGDRTDSSGDHWVWVGDAQHAQGGKPFWRIMTHGFGQYTLENEKYPGRMFAGDAMDSANEHWVWSCPKTNYSVRSKHVWNFVPA